MKKFLLICFGLLSGILSSIILYITFLYAYFSPTKSVRVIIQSYNESSFEFVVIPLMITVSIIALVVLLLEGQ